MRTHPVGWKSLARVCQRAVAAGELRVGVDVDGVLAEFNHAFLACLVRVGGPPRRPVPSSWTPETWDWPAALGYQPDAIEAAWADVRNAPDFWERLPALCGASALLVALSRAARGWHGAHAEVYFLTRRLGATAKEQTERWLARHGYSECPTVLIAHGPKGDLAKGLGLTFIVDDSPENIASVLTTARQTRALLRLAPYNRGSVPRLARHGGRRFGVVTSVTPIVQALTMLLSCGSLRAGRRGTATTTSLTSKAS